MTWFICHSNGVDIGATLATTSSILQQLLAREECWRQFLMTICLIDVDVIVVLILFVIESVREIRELVCERAWSHIDIRRNHFFFFLLI